MTMHCPHCGYGDLLDEVQDENGVRSGLIEKLNCPECGAFFRGDFWMDEETAIFKIETIRKPLKVGDIYIEHNNFTPPS